MFNYTRIPNEIKSLKRWVLWKLKDTDNGKTTKIPINANNGYGAKSNDDSTWVTFDIAMKNLQFYQCSGLGFMLGNGYFGIDLDDDGYKKFLANKISEDEYKQTRIEFEKLIEEFTEKVVSYTEVSQSGKGIHIICKGVLPTGARRKGNIEMYDNARFFAITGNIYKDRTEIEERTEEVKDLWDKYLKDDIDAGFTYSYNKNVSSILNDDEIIHKAQESSNGSLFTCLYYGQWASHYPSQSEADMSMCSMLAFWTNKDAVQMDRIFRSSKLYREKWDMKRGELTYGEITIQNAINRCKDTYNPSFTNNKSYNIATGEVESQKEYDLTDTGNAQRFVDRFGDTIRYNFDNKTWVYFDGKTWVKDVKQLVKTQADIMIEEMKIEAVKVKNEDLQDEMFRNIKRLSSNQGKEAMLKEAMHLGNIPTVNADYNTNEYVLNCFNGVVDLLTGEIKPHDKGYMMSKNTNIACDLNNEPTKWLKFLNEIFDNDKEMIAYVQRILGYTLTGSTREQCFFQCYGDGANGKSVFLDIVYSMLGDYSLNAQVDSILAKNNSTSGNATSEIARMNGARFVRTNEPNEGSRFNEGLVKQLVSGDVTTARYLYGQEFEFKPKFKLWIATNYKIGVRGTDFGIWRRMRLIPFKVKFDEKTADKGLTEKLQTELPQILGWCVKGCREWIEKGLQTPVAIEQENKQYKAEMDIIASFIDDNIIEKRNSREKATDIFNEYRIWAKNGNEYCMSQSKFGLEFSKRYEKKNISGYVYYLGVKLKKNDTSFTYTKDEVK